MTTTEKRRYTRTNEATRAEIVRLYSQNAATATEIAQRFGVSEGLVRNLVSAAKVTRAPALKRRAPAAASATPPPLPVLLLPTKKPTAAEIEEQITLANAAALATAGMLEHMLREALVTVKADPGAGAGLIRAAAHASEVAERIMKMRRATLRMDRENKDADVVLPELPVRDMMDVEVDRLRRKQALEDQLSDPDEIERILDREFTVCGPGFWRAEPNHTADDEADDYEAPMDDVIEGDDDHAVPEPVKATQAAPELPLVPERAGRIKMVGKPFTGWL